MLKKRGNVFRTDFRVNGRRVRLSLKTTDKAEAQARLAAYLAKPPSEDATGRGMTLQQAFTQAMRERGKWRDAKSPRSIQSLFDATCETFAPNTPVAALSKAVLLDAVDKWRKDLSASTINHRLSLLSVLFEVAGIDMPKVQRLKVRKGRMRVITDAELQALCDGFRAAGRADLADLCVFLMHTACRLSEALSLRWRDVWLDRGFIGIWENKADHPRTVPLSEGAAALLRTLENNGQDGPFTHLTVDHCDKQWSKQRRALGLEGDAEFVIHALRHSSLSRMADAGYSALEIKAYAGHKSIATTERYVHLSADRLRALARVHDRPASGDQVRPGTGTKNDAETQRSTHSPQIADGPAVCPPA